MVNYRNRAYLRIYRRRTRAKRQHSNANYLWWLCCKQYRPVHDGFKMTLLAIYISLILLDAAWGWWVLTILFTIVWGLL